MRAGFDAGGLSCGRAFMRAWRAGDGRLVDVTDVVAVDAAELADLGLVRPGRDVSHRVANAADWCVPAA
jgi:hypothetical protein